MFPSEGQKSKKGAIFALQACACVRVPWTPCIHTIFHSYGLHCHALVLSIHSTSQRKEVKYHPFSSFIVSHANLVISVLRVVRSIIGLEWGNGGGVMLCAYAATEGLCIIVA